MGQKYSRIAHSKSVSLVLGETLCAKPLYTLHYIWYLDRVLGTGASASECKKIQQGLRGKTPYNVSTVLEIRYLAIGSYIESNDNSG